MISLRYLIIALFVLILPSTQIYSQDRSGQIDELVQKYYDLGQFNGTILVAKNGNIIYSKGVGYADMENKIPHKTDTKFRLASVTKQFTAALILQLAEKGKIKLDGKLSEYLPYYRKDIGDKITISQILSHTAGIDNYTNNRQFMEERIGISVIPKEFILQYCSNDLISEPGTSWAYSNTGYFILGGVIEEVTGKTYGEVLQENILIPLGMENSGYEITGKNYDNFAKGYENDFGDLKPAKFADMSVPYSAGSMYSTVEDMLKWDRALYTEKVLSKESLQAMFTPIMQNYGYGWHIFDAPLNENLTLKIITHSGGISGFNSMESRLVEDSIFIMALNNFEGGSLSPLTQGIIHILYGMDAPEPLPSLAVILSKELKEKPLNEAILHVSSLKDNYNEYEISEREFNNLGYSLLQNEKVTEAIEVFKLNVEMFPQSANVYDSLGEAYAENGDVEKAILNYKKVLDIEPDNGNAKKMLDKLQGK